jgi:hypothetical protein
MSKAHQDETAQFTERAVMSLAVEIADLQENARRLSAIIAALALTYGVAAEIDPVSAIVK